MSRPRRERPRTSEQSEASPGVVGRAVWEMTLPPGGWPPPWPQALQLMAYLPVRSWTLVGGLMVQLHALHAGLIPPRPTVDVDVLLHIETPDGEWGRVSAALGKLGYTLKRSLDDKAPVHRFVRGPEAPGTPRHTDSAPGRDGGIAGQDARGEEMVDVLVADHAGPWAYGARSGYTPSFGLRAAPARFARPSCAE